MFKFDDKLKDGKNGEALFLKLFPVKLIRKSGYNEDFTIAGTETKLELKSDSYDLTKTDNFFMERYSDKSRKTPGGPWQALSKDIQIYAYFYVKNKEWFLFNTKELVEKLNELIMNNKLNENHLRDIPNDGYTTQGFKVNRKLLEDVLRIHGVGNKISNIMLKGEKL